MRYLSGAVAGVALTSAAHATQYDFGDAPSSYGEAKAIVDDELTIGYSSDAEESSHYSKRADGDDINADDEDGVFFVNGVGAPGSQGNEIRVVVMAGLNVPGHNYTHVEGWMDFNGNGTFEASEKIIPGDRITESADYQVFSFLYDVPANAVPGETFSRIRLSGDATNSPTGVAAGGVGEVEDQLVVIPAADASPELTCLRTVENTVRCEHGQVYAFYLRGGFFHTGQGLTWEEYSDGTARLTGFATRHDGSVNYYIDFEYGARTTVMTAGSPKNWACGATNTNGWVYYETLTGSFTDVETGEATYVSRRGPSTQMGVTANETASTLAFGGCGWFHTSDPDHPHGDVNLMLSQDCQLAPAVSCVRTVTNSVHCNNADVRKAFYLEGRNYFGSDMTWTEYVNDTARFTGIVSLLDGSETFLVEIDFSEKTTVMPEGSPKDWRCGETNTSDWTYYQNVRGTLVNGNTGEVIQLARRGPALQMGTTANEVAATADFGACFWFNTSDGRTGDLNIMLSENCELAALGDRVWKDMDSNGIQDAGEVGIGNIPVTLWTADANGTPVNQVASQVTKPNGEYRFDSLLPGQPYVVQFGRPLDEDCDYTQPNAGGNDDLDSDVDPATGISGVVVLDHGEYNASVDAGFKPNPAPAPASLGDLVFKDENSNGLQDSDEPGISEVTVNLWTSGPNGTPIDNVASVETDSEGNYRFTNLEPGQPYVVQFLLPATESDCEFTEQYQGNGAGSPDDSDVNVDTGMTGVVVLNEGEYLNTIDAGLKPTPIQFASLGNRVWKDENSNGLQESTEPGIAGVEVRLWLAAADGTLIDQVGSTMTNADGAYRFNGLLPGQPYVVEVLVPASESGCEYTDANVGNNDESDSDIDPNTGRSDVIVLADGEVNDSVDAGLKPTPVELASLGNRVWKDENSNGIQDADEVGIADVEVKLWAAQIDGTPIDEVATTNTNVSGDYTFNGLLPGQPYVVQFLLPANAPDCEFTEQDVTTDDADSDADPATGMTAAVVLSPGEVNDSVDAGLMPTPVELSSLGNRVWKDENSNGLQDTGEPGIAGVQINLWTAQPNGAPIETIGSTTTNATGKYAFTGLDPELTYVIEVMIPATESECEYTDQDAGNDSRDSDINPVNGFSHPIVLEPGANDNSIDSGLKPTPVELASLGDRVWKDENSNGVQDADEPGIGGVELKLWKAQADGTPIDQVASTTTDMTGAYTFNGLDPDQPYVVQIVVPAAQEDCELTDPNVGNDDGIDSDFDPVSGLTGVIVLTPGENNPTFDAGLKPTPLEKATLGNFVWKDKNSNGLQDSEEAGVAGAEVKLWTVDSDGNPLDVIQTVSTALNGQYAFTGVEPNATYIVQVIIPAGQTDCEFTKPDAGNDDVDSDVDPATGMSGPITLDEGEVNNSVDAGLRPVPVELASIGDRIWKDVNSNGLQDADESGIGGIVVKLWKADDTGAPVEEVGSTTSEMTGAYSFTGLEPGIPWVIQVLIPDVESRDCQYTDADAGGDDLDSDIDPMTGLSAPIVLTPGEANQSVDAGLKPVPVEVAKLGNYVFLDTNFNGLQDSGEPAVSGVTVKLWIDTDGDGGVDQVLATAATDNQGEYCFFDLIPGETYNVQFIDPEGRAFTVKDAGDDTLDSDVGGPGFSTTVVLSPGEVNNTIDAGLTPSTIPGIGNGDRAKITGLVWSDMNLDGVRSDDESPIEGVLVTLYQIVDGNAEPVDEKLTDVSGAYAFTVEAGSEYFVEFASPDDGSVPTEQDQGSDDLVDSDFDPNTGQTPVIVPGAGDHIAFDGGFTPPAPEDAPKIALSGMEMSCAENGDFCVRYTNATDIVLSEGWMVFMDTDNDLNSGYRAFGIGADAMLRNDKVYVYTGIGGEWSWEHSATASVAINGTTADVCFPRAALGQTSLVKYLFFGDSRFYPGQMGVQVFPEDAIPLTLVCEEGGDPDGITKDGDASDWVNAPLDIEDADDKEGPIDLLRFAVTEEASEIYVLYVNDPDNDFGQDLQVKYSEDWFTFIDADRSAGTGYPIYQSGADYLIQGRDLFAYTGENGAWGWTRVTSVVVAEGNNVVEACFPHSAIGSPEKFDVIFFGSNDNGGDESDVVPNDGSPLTVSLIDEPEAIVKDGDLSDWLPETLLGTDSVEDAQGEPINLEQLYAFQKDDKFYLGFNNVGTGAYDANSFFFLDTDNNGNTGYAVGQLGADYVIQGNQVLRFTGVENNEWAWTSAGKISAIATENGVVELCFPNAWIGGAKGFKGQFFGINPNKNDAFPDDYSGVTVPVLDDDVVVAPPFE